MTDSVPDIPGGDEEIQNLPEAKDLTIQKRIELLQKYPHNRTVIALVLSDRFVIHEENDMEVEWAMEDLPSLIRHFEDVLATTQKTPSPQTDCPPAVEHTEQSVTDHPLMRQDSLYGRLRSCYEPREKLIGYSWWVRARGGQGTGAELPGDTYPVTAVRLRTPEAPVHCTVHFDATDSHLHCTIEVEGLNGKQKVRVILVEPAVLDRLQEQLGGDASLQGLDAERMLRHILASDVLESNREVCRILSALPDFDGTISDGHFEEHIGVGEHVVYPRSGTTILVAIDDTATSVAEEEQESR